MKLDKVKLECAMAKVGVFTYRQLAARYGCSPSSLSHIINRGTCSVSTAAKLATALGVDVAELLPDKENR